jgi:hypothetical protein
MVIHSNNRTPTDRQAGSRSSVWNQSIICNRHKYRFGSRFRTFILFRLWWKGRFRSIIRGRATLDDPCCWCRVRGERWRKGNEEAGDELSMVGTPSALQYDELVGIFSAAAVVEDMFGSVDVESACASTMTLSLNLLTAGSFLLFPPESSHGNYLCPAE